MTDPKSSIPKCVHHVFSPRGTPGGIDNHFCSICTPIKIRPKPKTLLVRVDGEWKNLAKKKDESIAE
jgi:hypothetical protein